MRIIHGYDERSSNRKKPPADSPAAFLYFRLEVDAPSELQLAWVVGLSSDLAIVSQ